MTSPITPTTMMNMPLTTIHTLLAPEIYFHSVHSWIMAGKARPKADRQRAPNREMKSSRFGMATASRTASEIGKLVLWPIQMNFLYLHVTSTNSVLTTYSHSVFRGVSAMCFSKYSFHVMSMAT